MLVLDDDPTTLGLVGEVLGQLGATIHLSGTVDEARRLAGSVPLDVAIVDLVLRGESGTDFVRELTAGAPDLPVVAMAASVDPVVSLQALQAGAHTVVAKGVTADELKLAVLSAGRFGRALKESRTLRRRLAAHRAGLDHLRRSENDRAARRAGDTARDDRPGTAPAGLETRTETQGSLMVLD
ncbi:MAG: response regulator, partial [Candidatus Riflebacteria bacterium]|nr:response regulator [Candidatus Riflebacteria bacterium]